MDTEKLPESQRVVKQEPQDISPVEIMMDAFQREYRPNAGVTYPTSQRRNTPLAREAGVGDIKVEKSNKEFEAGPFSTGLRFSGDDSSVIKDFVLDRDAAARKTVGYIESSPDDAARALELEETTGVNSSAIVGDLEGFEKRTKSQMAGDLVRNNNYIADYINSHPMAAQLSNDDLGNLDTASQALDKLSPKGFIENTAEVFNEALKGITEGPHEFKAAGEQTKAYMLKHGANEQLAAQEAEVVAQRYYRGEVLQTLLWSLPTMVASPAIGAFRTYAAQPLEEKYGIPAQVSETAVMVALAMVPWLKAGKEPPIGVHPEIDKLKIDQSKGEVDRLMDAIKESQSSLTKERNPDMYARFAEQHTEDQSVGIHADAIRGLYKDKPSAWDDAMLGFVPGLDEKLITAEATGGYVDIPMSEYIAKVEPEVAKVLEDFTRVRATGVSKGEATDIKAAEKVEGLPPERAVETVRDVGALVPKERKLELKRMESPDAVSMGDTGFTNEQVHHFEIHSAEGSVADLFVAEEKGGKRLYIDDIRSLGSKANVIGPRQLRDLLQQLKTEFPNAEELTGFRVSGARDKAGSWETKGKVSIKLAAEKTPFEKRMEDFAQKNNLPEIADQQRIDNIKQRIGQIERDRRAGGKPEGGYPPHAELLGLRRRLRELEGNEGFSVRLAEPTAADNLFQILLDDRIERLGTVDEVGEGFTATTIDESRWQNFERSIVRTIDAELSKLNISDLDVEAVHKLQNEKGELVRGLYQSYENARPTILFALTADDPVGVLRHEVMHDLRTRGFLSEEEWGTLSKAAKDEGWLDKHDIKKRYDGLPDEGLIEEAIADEFANWRRDGKPSEGAWAKIFQKIDQLIETIRATMRQLFGSENWKDIFDKIESGEVAGRDPLNEFGDVTKEAIYSFDEEKAAPQAANDIDALQYKHPANYEAAVKAQQIERYVNENTERGDFKYWKDLAAKEGHNLESTGRPNAFVAAREHSLGGKTTLVITENGGRVVFSDGVKVVRERFTKASKGPAQPELPGTRRMEDRDVFAEAQAAGMTKDQYLRYMKLIAERHREDLRKESERALKDAKRRQTEEWKKNYAETREKVVEQINERPDIATDNLLREQRLFGRKTDPVQLGSEYLTADQKAALPKDYVSKDGIHPDDVAALTGYENGADLVQGLIGLDKDRKASGLRPIEYNRRLIAVETERQMEAAHGRLADNILEEAKEQVLSETQLDLLHEEVLAAGLKAGAEFPITKDQMKAWTKERFDLLDQKDVSSDKFLADAGRAGRLAEDALLKGDPAEAFRQKQRQYMAVAMTRYAKDFEKAKEEFEKTAKRYSSREVGGASQEYTDAIHAMMVDLGLPVRRSVQDIAEGMRKNDYANLKEFVDRKESSLRDLYVPDWLVQGGKKLNDLTTQEAQELFKAMKAMTFNSRDELKINKAGEKFELDQVIEQMVEQIKSLGEPKEYPIDRKESIKEYGKSWWWSGINVESMLNRLDRDRSGGLFNQFIIRHFTEASNYKDKLIRDFQGKISEVGNIKDMDRLVENELFIDPITGEKFRLRRRNVLGILQQVGNESSLNKLAKGYKVKPEQVMEWLHKNTTKEDWDRAQKIGDVFKEIYGLADNMSHNVSGVGIESLPLAEIQTPHGNYPGWYNPVKYDSLRPGESKKLLGPNALEEEGFYRATTPQGYTKGRTGYAAPVELNLDIVPIRMRQMLHDIAMRPAVLQLSKVFYNPKFERAMISYFGKHQAKEMIPFLHDIANSANFKSMSASYGDRALEYFRQNTITTLIGFNPGTVMKHGATAAINSLAEVGVTNFAREFATLLSDSPEGGTNWRLAMDKSEELQRRMRNYSELISGHGSEINIRGARSKFQNYREFMMNAGATPVSISDLLSAVPTWLARYKDSVAKGADEGQAVFEADRAVRHAHGSSVLSNKPAIARTNALGAWFSSLYGFFSHMQQKQYELSWKAKDLVKDTMGSGSGDLESATRHAPDLLKGFMSYVILPAIIEEMVTPYTNAEKDSWGMKAVKTLALGIGSSLIGVRDFVNSLVNNREPQAGLAATTFKFAQDLPKDLLSKQPMSKDRAAKVLHHTFSTVGILTGLTNNTEGSIAEYIYRYNKGLEHPKSPVDIFSGLRHGKTKH